MISKFLILFWCCLVTGIVSPSAQTFVGGGYLPLSWEQAGMLAAKENKLVFVDVMSSGMKRDVKKEKAIFGDRRVADFLKRNAIMIQVDMMSPAAKDFGPRLMMNMYPAYAFFMPYGDLLEIVRPAAISQDPELLIAAGEKALKLAEIKRKNSRSILFEEGTLEEALVKAGKLGKMVFIDAYTDYCQPCLMMEKNIFTLDSVADFYNRNFVNMKLHFGNMDELAKKYNVGAYPSFLFINSAGKLVYKAGGYSPAEQFIGYGREALKKAEGVVFQQIEPEMAMRQAGSENKLILLSFYDSADKEYKEMVKSVFTDPEVTDLLTTRFVNVAWEKGQKKDLQQQWLVKTFPTFIFTDAGGKEVHRFTGNTDIEGLLQDVRNTLAGKGLVSMGAEYRSGNRQEAFVEAYISALGRADNKVEAEKITLEYLSGMDKNRLKEKKYWELFNQYVSDANSPLFQYIYANRNDFFQLYGQSAVEQKIRKIWAAGADRYVVQDVTGYTFDEAGLKAYSQRMKKEKVQDWRGIVRNTRMLAAEKTGNWKRYVELAEEKWNEENISDAELYSWGVKINHECRDEATRYKAARWFALAAIEMQEKERLSGKKNLTSYKSFFEKLVDDLVEKK